ncbi:MAG: undecaprenyl-diphosphate phosphatase [Alphaproteobacteria bacterium]|nr:undecaprenyl-diphosphate phosphatase [Alphaproteobacteria bacterium]
MSLLQVLVLSIVQGITEFLPVSSSGHLILVSKFTDFPDQGLAMDVAVHIGSIAAVLIYFAKDIWNIVKGVFKEKLLPSFANEGCKLFWLIIIASIPAAMVGLMLNNNGMEWMRNTKIIGWNILIFGILLWFADRCSLSIRKIENIGLIDAILIGLAQCLSLIPGTSRSGITITMSRFLGIERREAAKFCMLLSIPTIAGAGLLVGYQMLKNGAQDFDWVMLGIVFSFAASLSAIWIMMNWLKNRTFLPFVVYRVILGTVLLLYSYDVLRF